MIDLPYSLVVEATDDPAFFGFYSPDLEGFTGVGSSIEDCVSQSRDAMGEHVELLRDRGLAVPSPNPDPVITVRNQRADVRGSGEVDPHTPGRAEPLLQHAS